MSYSTFAGSFPDNASSFDNPDTYPDVEFVIPGLQKPLRLHTEILSKASLAFAHMFKGNDLAFCKFDQGAHRVEWTDEKAANDETYRNALEKVLRFCYGTVIKATPAEVPVLSSIFDQIQVQGKDTVKRSMEEYLVRVKESQKIREEIDEIERKQVQKFIREHPGVSSRSFTMYDGDKDHSGLCVVLKRNATPTQTLDMECFGMRLNAIDEKEVDYKNTAIGKELAEALNTNTTLTSLTVRVHPEGANAICKSLQTNKTLTLLCIKIPGSCEKSCEFGEQLEPMLRINSTLKTLDFSSATVGDKHAKSFFDALKTCHTLETLKLSFKCNQGEFIGGALESNHGIKELSLDLYRELFPALKPIGEALKTNSTLTKLKLSSERDIGERVRELAEGLKSNHSVTLLDLSCMCKINPNAPVSSGSRTLGVEGAKGIGLLLQLNSTLTTLNLFNTGLGDTGLLAIADGLSENSSLRELNLGYNHAVDEGIIALFEVLKTNKALTSLDVSFSKMEKKASAMIADMLKVNTSLKELNLSYCDIGEKTTKKIMEALKVNTTLTSFKYKGNKIGNELYYSFSTFLRDSQTIKTQEIDYAFEKQQCKVM